jgi:hypothetical protein
MTVLPNLQQQLEQALAANAALQAKLIAANKPKAMTMKVSEKGGLSVYGLGRYPVTLYRSQWERLLGAADTIREFIADNADLLTTKD